MNIAIVNPGVLRVPASGYGAIEKIIWEMYQKINALGHYAEIIDVHCTWETMGDDTHISSIIDKLKLKKFDVIHFHCEKFYKSFDKVEKEIPGAAILFSSHNPYIGYPEIAGDIYVEDYKIMINNKTRYNVCVSKKDFNMYVKDGANPSKMFISRNGCSDKYRVSLSPKNIDKTVCLAAVEPRKGQHLLQDIVDIDFIGPILNSSGIKNIDGRFLGEKSTDFLTDNLTEYGNFVLLTTAENGTPLVVQEALMSGLGVVISEYAAWELDRSLPFISIIPDEKFSDTDYIRDIILKNKTVSINMRKEIRQYAEKTFSWDAIINSYILNIEKVLNDK